MKRKTTLEQRIRGWFPKEPKFPSRNSPAHLPMKHKALSKPVIRIASFLAVYTATLSFFFAFSTLQTALVILTALVGLFWFIANRTNYKHTSFFLRRGAIVLLAFIVVFSGFQFFVFETSGYPATAAPKLTYPAILNASLTQYLQEVERSENFQLLQLNHVNSATFERLELHVTVNSGWVTWTFRTTDTNSKVTIGNMEGSPYYTSVDSLLDSVFPRQTYQTKDYALQETAETFQQIDNTELNTFLNRALESYRIRPNATAQISSLSIYVGFDDSAIYQGLTFQLRASSSSRDNMERPIYIGLFEAEFKPDGTMLSYGSLG